MSYVLIACDTDETLLNDHETNKETVDAIIRAKRIYVKFVPATGRGYLSNSAQLKNTRFI